MSKPTLSAETEESIATILKRRRCIAWVGSGLSQPARYWTWKETIDELVAACKPKLSFVPKYTAGFMSAAEKCKLANLSTYEETLGTHFGRNVSADRRAYKWLAQLPFEGYVTTNFDPLLKEAVYDKRKSLVEVYPELVYPRFSKSRGAVAYMHGIARNNLDQACGKNLVLTKSDFGKAYGDAGQVSLFLKSILLYHDIVFIGCQLEEPGIAEAFAQVHEIHDQFLEADTKVDLPIRVMMRPKIYGRDENTNGTTEDRNDRAERSECRKLSALGLRVFRYEPDEHHSGIDEALKSILKLISEKRTSAKNPVDTS